MAEKMTYSERKDLEQRRNSAAWSRKAQEEAERRKYRGRTQREVYEAAMAEKRNAGTIGAGGES